MDKIDFEFSSWHTPSTGHFITFEGIEGCGKTTQIQKLSGFLRDRGYSVLCLREPGGTDVGEQIRQVLLHATYPLHPLSESLLFLASRAQLIHEKILPHLAQGGIVLLDRYLDSTLAYQALAQNLSPLNILQIHSQTPLNLLPHLTFYLDIDYEVSLQRQQTRGQKKDYFESRDAHYFLGLIKAYRLLAQSYPQRIVTHPGDQDVNQIFSVLKDDILKRRKL